MSRGLKGVRINANRKCEKECWRVGDVLKSRMWKEQRRIEILNRIQVGLRGVSEGRLERVTTFPEDVKKVD